MSGGDDQMGHRPAQPRPVLECQIQSVNGDNCGGTNCCSFLHGPFLNLYPPLLSGPGQFEQRSNERPLLTHGCGWARANQRWIYGGRKKGLEEERRDGEAVRRERRRKENERIKNKK